MNMGSRAYVCVAVFLLCSSSFGFAKSDGAPATTTAAPATSSVAPSASSVAPSAEATVNATDTTANVTEASEAPTTMVVTTAAPEPKNVTLTMSITINSVSKEECEKVKEAENPTEAPATPATVAPTTATEPTTNPNATAEATSTVAATTQAATEATTAATEAPTTQPKPKERKRRVAVDKFDAKSFVAAFEKRFAQLMTDAGAEDASVDVTNIACGSISPEAEMRGAITTDLDTFKGNLQKEANKGVQIQNRAVAKQELIDAVQTVKEKEVTPEVSTGGLSDGAIAGIVIGVVLLLIIIVLVAMALKKGSRQSADLSSTSRVKLSEVQDGR